ELAKKVHGLARPERPGDAITEVDRSIGAALANVVKHRLECGQIAMDVGDDGEAQGDFSILPEFPGSVLRLSAFRKYCQRARRGGRDTQGNTLCTTQWLGPEGGGGGHGVAAWVGRGSGM